MKEQIRVRGKKRIRVRVMNSDRRSLNWGDGTLTLLDVVVREGAAILELLAGEDETLLIRGDALLVLDLGLDVLDRVGGLDLEGDGLASQSLDEDLHGDCSLKQRTLSLSGFAELGYLRIFETKKVTKQQNFDVKNDVISCRTVLTTNSRT